VAKSYYMSPRFSQSLPVCFASFFISKWQLCELGQLTTKPVQLTPMPRASRESTSRVQ